MVKNLSANAADVYSMTDGPPVQLESAILNFGFAFDHTISDKVGWFALLVSAANREARPAKDATSRSRYLASLQDDHFNVGSTFRTELASGEEAAVARVAAKFQLALRPLYSGESARWLWECLMGDKRVRDADLQLASRLQGATADYELELDHHYLHANYWACGAHAVRTEWLRLE